MRIAIGGIAHETSTFATVPTTLDDFIQRGYYADDELLTAMRGTKSSIGGFMDALRDLDMDVVPTLMASAQPAGPVTAEATEVLTARLVDRLRAAQAEGPLDGVLLALHGAMISELDDDGEAYVLRAVREVLPPGTPLLITLDLHGNISEEMVGLCTVPIAFDEYPHTDPYERAYEAGVLLARILRGGAKPVSAMVKMPLSALGPKQYSHAQPMLGVKHLAHDIEGIRGVLNVSYLPGFIWADISLTDFTIIVTTDNDPDLAREQAERLATYIWERREEFVGYPTPVDEAVQQAIAAPQGPIVLADIADNPGGGTPADGTVVLESLLRHGARDAVIVPLCDPAVVQEAIAAGEGATITTTIGGKVDDMHGPPLDITARVVRLTDGRFTHKGVMATGVQMDVGPTAVLEVEGANGGSVQVITTTYRMQPTDLEMIRSQGIEPTEQQILVVKSSMHYRAAFTPIAMEIIEVDGPGLTSPRFPGLTWHNLRRPMYPFDTDFEWTPQATIIERE